MLSNVFVAFGSARADMEHSEGMSKTAAASRQGSRSWVRRAIPIGAIVAMTALLAVGLVGFFADPLNLPPQMLEVLDKRASVVSMFIGAAGLVVAIAALLLQLRPDRRQDVAETPNVPDPEVGSSPRSVDTLSAG